MFTSLMQDILHLIQANKSNLLIFIGSVYVTNFLL